MNRHFEDPVETAYSIDARGRRGVGDVATMERGEAPRQLLRERADAADARWNR